MNAPITGWDVAGIILLLAAIIVAVHWPGIRERLRHVFRNQLKLLLDDFNRQYPSPGQQRREQRLRDHLDAEAERLFPDPGTTRWPDLCATPPCDLEDGWLCTRHQPRGKHHAVWQGSLDDQPAEVILAVITEVQNKRQS